MVFLSLCVLAINWLLAEGVATLSHPTPAVIDSDRNWMDGWMDDRLGLLASDTLSIANKAVFKSNQCLNAECRNSSCPLQMVCPITLQVFKAPFPFQKIFMFPDGSL